MLASLNLSLLTDKLTAMLPVLICVLAVLRGVVRSRVALHLEVRLESSRRAHRTGRAGLLNVVLLNSPQLVTQRQRTIDVT